MKSRKRFCALTLIFRAALCAALFAAALAACRPPPDAAPGSPAAGERRLVDREGSPFTLRGVPRRIVSGAPSNTEIIAALGLAGNIIATDRYSAQVPGVPPGIPLIDFFYPDAETIISLEPDIIFANGYNRFGAGDDPFRLIKESGVAVVYIPMTESIAGIYADIAFIAEALGADEQGAKIIETMKAEIEAVRKTAEGAAFDEGAAFSEGAASRSGPLQKRNVYFEISPAPDMVTLGKKTYLHEMIELAGGINIFGNQEGILFPSAEIIVEQDPDVILSSVNYTPNPLEEIRSRPGFGRIKAVREGRLFLIDGDSASRPTQNIVKALRQMGAAIYPELFAKE